MRKNTLDFLKEYFPLIISLFILSTISIIHIFTNDLWIDESSSLITTEVSLLKVIQQALIWEEQAPLYYFILGIWRLISTNYMFARFLSLIFMLLSVVKIYMIIKQYEKSKLLLTLFLLFISINHNAIYSAVNIRYYSLTIFICVILICQFLKYYVSDIKPDLKEKIFFSIVATISILTQYYIGFLLLAIGGVILIHKGFKDFFRYCILMILPITVIILQCIIIFSQVETYLAYNMQGSGVLGMFKFILVKIEDNLVAFNSFPDVRWLRYLIRIVYVFVLVTAFINRGKIRHEAKYLIFLLVIMFIPLSVLYFTMGDDFICFRHTMFLYFPIILLFFFVIKPLNFNLKIIILSFILAMNVLSEYQYISKPNVVKELNSFLCEVENENEPIFVYPNEQKLNLHYQYSGVNELFGVPFNIDCSGGYKINHWVIRDSNQLDSMFINSLTKATSNFYVVIEDHFTFMNIDFKFNYFLKYLNKSFICDFDTSINNYRVLKLSIPVEKIASSL